MDLDRLCSVHGLFLWGNRWKGLLAWEKIDGKSLCDLMGFMECKVLTGV